MWLTKSLMYMKAIPPKGVNTYKDGCITYIDQLIIRMCWTYISCNEYAEKSFVLVILHKANNITWCLM